MKNILKLFSRSIGSKVFNTVGKSFCVSKLSNKLCNQLNNEFIQKKKDSECSDNCEKERKTKLMISEKGTILLK